MKKIILVIISSFLMLNLSAAEVIGRVTKVRGNILRTNVSSPDQRDLLKTGMEIHVGDTVESEERSFAKILMKDDTIFSIGPETEFAFENFQEKQGNDRDATYNLVRGKLRSLFTKKAPKRTLKIKTPSASMAVRGTDIATDVYQADGEVRTDIGLISGKLEVHTRGKIIELKPQEIFEASKGSGDKGPGEFAKKQLDQKVFDLLKKSQNKGGTPFLNDAFNKAGLKRKADFSRVSFHGNTSKARMPASVGTKPVPQKEKNPYTVLEDVRTRKGPVEDIRYQNEQIKAKEGYSDQFAQKRRPVRQMEILKPCPVGTVLIGGVCRKPLIEDTVLKEGGTTSSTETQINTKTSTETGTITPATSDPISSEGATTPGL